MCLPCDALLQHLPSYLGFSYLGHGLSLHGCSSKAQPLLLTLDEGYLLSAALPGLQRGIAPLGRKFYFKVVITRIYIRKFLKFIFWRFKKIVSLLNVFHIVDHGVDLKRKGKSRWAVLVVFPPTRVLRGCALPARPCFSGFRRGSASRLL